MDGVVHVELAVAPAVAPSTNAAALTTNERIVDVRELRQGHNGTEQRRKQKADTEKATRAGVSEAQKAVIRGSLDRSARVVAEELGLTKSAASYWATRFRKEAAAVTEASPVAVAEPFRGNGRGG